MSHDFAAAIAAVASASPMASGSVPVLPGRVLLVDGDGLAYYCAGKDGSSVGDARRALNDKVESAARLVSAERVIILLTGSGSHKGHRYAIARRKPYQGQRANSRRPENWAALRDYLTGNECRFPVEITYTAEADDLFGKYAYTQPDDVVIYTQDKDMRMLPGRHLDWVTHRMHQVGYVHSWGTSLTVCNSEFNEKQYGPKWFWLQMLHGDTADNIPGLPKYKDTKDLLKPVGEVTAGKLLAGETDLKGIVATCYESYYGDRWLVEMMEQACLLWMRREPDAWDDCLNPGGPLDIFNDGEATFAAAYLEIQSRVREANDINAIKAE